MLLAIDIGNTSAVFGLFDGDRLIKRWSVLTGQLTKLRSLNLPRSKEIKTIWACSVVPKANDQLKKLLPKPVRFVTAKNLPLIKVKTNRPSEVGADRLVNALAAHEILGVPAIVVDFGTATTIDVIDKKGRYLGGIIAPGLGLGREALAKKTALLPWLGLKIMGRSIKRYDPSRSTVSMIGQNTVQAMSLGLLAGQAAMIDEFIIRISQELKAKPKVIATGGYAGSIVPFSRKIKMVDEDLTLKGLCLIGNDSIIF